MKPAASPLFRRLLPTALLLASAAAWPVGCSEAPPATEAIAPTDRLVQPEGEQLPTLSFYAGWMQRLDYGPLLANRPVKILYAPERMPTCRGTHNGYRAWAMTALYRPLPDGAVREVQLGNEVSGVLSATFTVPPGTRELELWFHTTNISRCEEWDSAYGANYRFSVSDPAVQTTVRFDDGWNETLSGPIVRGGSIRVDYDPRRLPDCRATYAGGRTWNILAGYRFHPGNQTGAVALFEGNYYAGDAGITQPSFAVPDDATEVELWFTNNDRAGCVRYDSDFGANYRFPIDGREALDSSVQWGGDWNLVGFHRERQELGDVDPAYYWSSMGGAEYVTWLEAEVYAPGITDRSYADDAARRLAATTRLQAIVSSDAIARQAGAELQQAPLTFERQEGNNFVYSWRWLDLFTPNALPDGLYQYRFHFSTDGGLTWFTVARPDGSPRRVVLASTQRCDLFPDHAPAGCPRPELQVGWAGDWHALRTHGCTEGPLEEPAVFSKSGLGHDCMTITADVYVPEYTERDADPAGITAEVLTDLGFGGGPGGAQQSFPLSYVSRVGNNYRYQWGLGEHVGRSAVGDYHFSFRFSMDEGATWYTIATGEGPAGGAARTLRVAP